MILKLNDFPVKVLFPKDKSPVFDGEKRLSPFSEEIILALSQLGLFLMKQGRSEPSIVAAGYWLRKKQLLDLKSEYSGKANSPKGVTFHIAPGNVDTLFFYSMIISVLCGNLTILRISNKLSEETRAFISLIELFFKQHPEFSNIRTLMNIIQYDHSQNNGIEITKKISLFTDARVVWGGDKTVNDIGKIPKKNADSDIAFPDRYSVSVIQIKSEQQLEQAVSNLLTDIKPFNQQACSSPKVIYWLATDTKWQDEFNLKLAEKLAVQVTMNAADLVSQLVYLQRLPLLSSKAGNVKLLSIEANYLKCAEVKSISIDMLKAHCGLWVLLYQSVNHLDEIILFDHCQTVTMSGIEKTDWEAWQSSTKHPVKRIVSAGHALTFSHIWDGVDLIKALSK